MTQRVIRSGTWTIMPEWSAAGIILSVRPHGEGSAVVTVLTSEHGRHAGLVRGGLSSKMRGTLQPGNRIRAGWRARLPEQLGQMQIELDQSVSALLLDDPLRLAGMASICELLDGALPEREPQPNLYNGTNALLDLMCIEDSQNRWIEGYIRWELGLLHAVGFRLELDRCAASGQSTNLGYVSPKSGGAVAIDQVGEYVSRMLALPQFLGGVSCKEHDYAAGIALTAHFLGRRVFGAHNLDIPTQRKRLGDMVVGIYGS